MTESVRVVIIGGGPAAYTAGIYLSRAGLEPVCIEGYASGGQVMRSGSVDNFPGFPGGMSGAELADRIRQQSIEFGTRMVMAEVASVDLEAWPREIHTDDGETYQTQSLVIATGASPRRLGIPGEDEFDGRGVAYCAICDGPFFAGRTVAVVGGGDAAGEEALALSALAKRVTLIHRRDEFRANPSIQAAVRATANIDVYTPYVVTEVIGDEGGVTGIRTQHVDSGDTTEHTLDGLFVAIGHEPNSGLFTRSLVIDEHGFIRTAANTRATNVPGVFVAGDVSDPRYRQAVTAAASGAQAAIDAERWISSRRGNASAPLASAHLTV